MVVSPARLIVMEKAGRWAAAMRRAAGKRQLPLVETRSPQQAERELTSLPASIVAVEITSASTPAALKRLADWRERFPQARFIALAGEELAPEETALREAGATHVEFSPRDMKACMRLIRRHLASAPQPDMPLEEAIWSRLPWSTPGSPSSPKTAGT